MTTHDWGSIRFDLAQLVSETANTPDLAKLEQQLTQLVFIPDALKRGEPEHEKLEFLDYRGFVYTHRKFVGYKFKGEDNPFFLSNTDYIFFKAEPAPVSGELYHIATPSLIDLDNLRSNGVKYQRVYVKLVLPFRYQFPNKDHVKYNNMLFEEHNSGLRSKMQFRDVWAWMYVGVKEYWHKRMDEDIAFSPVTRLKPNSNWTPSYYFFSHNDKIKTNIE